MSDADATIRIPDEILAEQWYGFVHRLIEGMQLAYRNSGEPQELTQKKIAERLGKKPSFVSRCLSGQQNMTIRTIHDLARAMDCRLEVTFRPLKSLRPANNPATSRIAIQFLVGDQQPIAVPVSTAAENFSSVIQDAP